MVNTINTTHQSIDPSRIHQPVPHPPPLTYIRVPNIDFRPQSSPLDCSQAPAETHKPDIPRSHNPATNPQSCNQQATAHSPPSSTFYIFAVFLSTLQSSRVQHIFCQPKIVQLLLSSFCLALAILNCYLWPLGESVECVYFDKVVIPPLAIGTFGYDSVYHAGN